MFVSAYTVCQSRAQMLADVEPTTFSSCEGLKVWSQTTVSTLCSSYLMPTSAFQYNTPTYLLHTQQAMGRGHATPTLTSSV